MSRRRSPTLRRPESKPPSSSRTRGSRICSRTRWWCKPPSFPRRRRSDDSESRILCRASIFAAAFITAGAERFVSRLTRGPHVGWVEPQAKPNVPRSESKPPSSSRTRGSRILSLTHVAWTEVFITASAERFVSRLTREGPTFCDPNPNLCHPRARGDPESPVERGGGPNLRHSRAGGGPTIRNPEFCVEPQFLQQHSLPRVLNVLFRASRASFFCQSTQKKPKGLPLPWPSAALQVPSLRRHSGGTARRAIHGPTRLSRLPAAQPPTRRLHSACDKRGG